MQASIPYVREIYTHPPSGLPFLVFGGTKRQFVSVPGSTATNQIAAQINAGAVDHRGDPDHTSITHFLEGLETV